MPRIALVDPSIATGSVKTLLDGIARKLGYVPPLMRVLANSPASLSGYVGFMNALAGGAITAANRERIALALAQTNDCRACLAAHTGYAKATGLTSDEIVAARSFSSAEPEAAAMLAFAHAMLDTRGHLSHSQFVAVRESGIADGALVEIAALVAINLFTNSVNSLADVEATPSPL